MSIKVLIAHGNIHALKNAVSELHAAGFEVSATPDGGDAFARFFEERPDIVICSTELPSLAGANIARMVHSQSPETAVVLLTTGAHPEPPPEGVAVLQDPLSLPALREALPQFAFDTLSPPEPEKEDDAPATPVKVFVQAVLKRFQRDNRALSVLDEHGILRMAAIAENRAFEARAVVIRQGDDGDGFYLVVEGQVRVTLAEKGDKEVARIEAGGFFGEMALLSDTKRSASVATVGPTTLLWFDKQKFLPLLNEYPTMREVLSGVALKRTEENLWRVLFDDEEVQRSLAQLDTRAPGEAPPADIDIDIQTETASDTPRAARSVGGTSASGIDWLARFNRLPRFWTGAAAGFIAGWLGAWVMRPAAAPQTPPPIVQKQAPKTELAKAASLPTAPTAAANEAEPKASADKPAAENPADAKPAEAKPADAKAEEPKAVPPTAPPHEAPPTHEAPATPTPREVPATPPPREVPATAQAGDRHDDILGASKDKNWRRVLTLAQKNKGPLDAETAFAIAEAQRQGGTAEAALVAYTDFFKNFPSDNHADDAEFWAAEIYRGQGKHAEAKALYEKVAADPNSNFRKSAQKHL